jgi:hypothetical protein
VAVAGAGDANGDGYSDLLIGASSTDHAGTDAGTAYLVLGGQGPTGASLSTAIQYSGMAAGDNAGYSVAGAGDANGDGYSDLLIGAWRNDDGGPNAGATYLILSDALNSNSPSYRQRQRLNGSGNALPVTFEPTRVRVDFTTGALAGSDVTLSRHAFHPCSTDKRLQMPIWTVESAKMTTGTTLDLSFNYTDMNIQGLTEANLKVWTRPTGDPCGPWTQVASSTVNATHNRITATGLTSLSQFTIADAQPSPTALQERALAVRLAQEPLELVVLLALLVVMAGGNYWYLRPQGSGRAWTDG